METQRYQHRHLDVACSLDAAAAGARGREWQRLRDSAVAEAIPGGIRLWLDAGLAHTAADLAQREASCCGFLDLELAQDGSRLRLDITSPSPEAGPVIALLTGDQLDCEPGCC